MLLKYKITLREPSEYSKDDWRIYGKRKVGVKTVDHKGELRTVAAIKEMYSEGVSIAAIARFLDAMKIPTKQQGKGWHRGIVAPRLLSVKDYTRQGKHDRQSYQPDYDNLALG